MPGAFRTVWTSNAKRLLSPRHANAPASAPSFWILNPTPGYWQGGADNVRPFMLALRSELGARFHIGMSVDPRKHHRHSVFPR